jgi:hypothetical protein
VVTGHEFIDQTAELALSGLNELSAAAPRHAGMLLLPLTGGLFQRGPGTTGVVVVVDRAHLLRHGFTTTL